MDNTTRATLAVALIVKNEAQHLDACLASVADWVDEIVILDSGSTDATEKIARRYTEKFYVSDDWPGFGLQRQRAQQYVTADYVLWLDADERVTPELRSAIEEAVLNNNDCIYRTNRLSVFLDKEIRYGGWYPDYVSRLYKTNSTTYNNALVHEKVIEGNLPVEKLTGDLIHYPYQNISHYLNKSNYYAKSWSEDRYAKGKRVSLCSPFSHGLYCFIKMYVLKRGFLAGKQGLILSMLSSFSAFNKYLCLWEKDNHKS
uniref:glycosyltransferase family 2 protein n=1 Tax=Thaumasiovibrio occultus TaxID=1891184 RepID=UPI000B34D9F4|nr:glycosyltransferase family 2 protein [Thaumasiovibrio occultus]